MEFHESAPPIPVAQIHSRFRLDNLEEWSQSLILLDEIQGDRVYIGGIWGEFTLQRTELSVGVRFALLECPYALSWTISSPPENGNTHLHFHVNRDQVCSQFHSELTEVMNELQEELSQLATQSEGRQNDPAHTASACEVRYSL